MWKFFIEIWCIVISGSLNIWFSSTSFWKSKIGWPQEPLTEKVLKFNLIFHDSTPKNFFSKHKNKAEFKNLDDSESIFFSALLFISKSWYFYWFQCQCSRWLCYLLGNGFDFFYLICNTMYLSDYQSLNHQWQFSVHCEHALLFNPTKMELTVWQIKFLSQIHTICFAFLTQKNIDRQHFDPHT